MVWRSIRNTADTLHPRCCHLSIHHGIMLFRIGLAVRYVAKLYSLLLSLTAIRVIVQRVKGISVDVRGQAYLILFTHLL